MSCYIYRNNMKVVTSFRIYLAELILNNCINEDVAGWKLASDGMLIHLDDYSPSVFRPLKYKPRTKGGCALIYRLGLTMNDKPYINCGTRIVKADWLRMFV